MIDYAAKLALYTKDKDDTERINNVYIDLDNLASRIGIRSNLDCTTCKKGSIQKEKVLDMRIMILQVPYQ